MRKRQGLIPALAVCCYCKPGFFQILKDDGDVHDGFEKNFFENNLSVEFVEMITVRIGKINRHK